jgi:hypothetical protein
MTLTCLLDVGTMSGRRKGDWWHFYAPDPPSSSRPAHADLDARGRLAASHASGSAIVMDEGR